MKLFIFGDKAQKCCCSLFAWQLRLKRRESHVGCGSKTLSVFTERGRNQLWNVWFDRWANGFKHFCQAWIWKKKLMHLGWWQALRLAYFSRTRCFSTSILCHCSYNVHTGVTASSCHNKTLNLIPSSSSLVMQVLSLTKILSKLLMLFEILLHNKSVHCKSITSFIPCAAGGCV